MNDENALTDPKSPPAIVARFLAGESLGQLMASNGLAARELYQWMLTDESEQYKPLVTQALVARVADADASVAVSSDKLELARGIAQAKFARLDLERKRPHLYGSQLHVQSDTQVTVQILPPPRIVDVRKADDGSADHVSLNTLLGEPESEST